MLECWCSVGYISSSIFNCSHVHFFFCSCLEMIDSEIPQAYHCSPEGLVQQVHVHSQSIKSVSLLGCGFEVLIFFYLHESL